MQLDSGKFADTLPDLRMVFPSNESTSLMQTCLFDQVSRLLLRLSQRFPLLIILDDLQWCDSASASLLFYLGSHLSAGRILLLGAYRPEDMISTGDGDRHPMIPVLHEFQRRFGEIQIDLSLTDGWTFVNGYLDHEPNHFDQEFRKSFYLHTHGNALFTVELLHAMKERGEVIQDSSGYWISNPYVDWECLPARVEAVIAERLSRLDHESLALLEAACLQGEVFMPGALADVLGVTEAQITTRLSGSLSRQHRLVSSLSPVQHDGLCQASYQFRHILYQKYLYQSLDDVERGRLQKATAESLERNARNH
jgi:predicted ATPase